jgi:hypothetical protein
MSNSCSLVASNPQSTDVKCYGAMSETEEFPPPPPRLLTLEEFSRPGRGM